MKTIEIKELIQHKQAALEAMFNYLQNDNIQLLINSLYKLEINAYLNTGEDLNKNIWFKFFKNDPLCTTIKDIKLYLNDNDKEREFMLEQFDIAIKENSLEVYYS